MPTSSPFNTINSAKLAIDSPPSLNQASDEDLVLLRPALISDDIAPFTALALAGHSVKIVHAVWLVNVLFLCGVFTIVLENKECVCVCCHTFFKTKNVQRKTEVT